MKALASSTAFRGLFRYLFLSLASRSSGFDVELLELLEVLRVIWRIDDFVRM